jgi:hypothetical protein
MMNIYTYVPHTVQRPYAIIIVLIMRIRNCLPFGNTWVHPGFWWGSCCSSFYFSVLCIFSFCLFPVSYVPNGASFSVLFLYLMYPMVPVSLDFSCVLCTKWCQFLWIIHFWLPLRFFLERLSTFFIIRISEFVEHNFQLWMKTTNYSIILYLFF